MTDETVSSDADSGSAGLPTEPAGRILLVSYPKIVFMYPTLIAAILCGLYMSISGAIDVVPDAATLAKAAAVADNEKTDAAKDDAADEEAKEASDEEPAAATVEDPSGHSHFVARIFILVLTINLVVISFDFPRTTSLTIFFLGVALIAIVWSLIRNGAIPLGAIGDFVAAIRPFANGTFYFFVAAILLGLFVGVFVSVRFDYWEVRPNELLHHHGFLSDLERFSAPNLRIDKEINDIFEYLLLRSGRLILHPSNERRAVVLENVFFINRKESEITRMLGAVQVQVRNTT